MGSCFSTTLTADADITQPTTTAKVITLSGELKEYYSPIKISLILGDKSPTSFLCNSDSLYHDEHIPSLKPEDPILPGQLYFVLPIEKLEYPLTGADMAALAVRASSALLAAASRKRGRSKGKDVKVMPESLVGNEEFFDDGLKGCGMGSVQVSSRPVPVKKKRVLLRSRSLRSKIASSSYSSTLGSVDEVAELSFRNYIIPTIIA